MVRGRQAGLAEDGFTDFAMTFGGPDFMAYAKAYGPRAAGVCQNNRGQTAERPLRWYDDWREGQSPIRVPYAGLNRRCPICSVQIGGEAAP